MFLVLLIGYPYSLHSDEYDLIIDLVKCEVSDFTRWL